jgi:hypothetical protein
MTLNRGRNRIECASAVSIHMLCLSYAQRSMMGLNGLVSVGPVGLEPTTYGLKVRSSAN